MKNTEILILLPGVKPYFNKQPNDDLIANSKLIFALPLFHIMAAGTSLAILTQASYPTQLIAKCAKPIIAMICLFVVYRRFYTIQRHFCLVAIAVVVVLFMIRSDCTGLGIIMISVYLAMNGAMVGMLEYTRKSSSVLLIDIVFNMHAFSTAILGFIFIASFDILQFMYYVTQNPIVLCLIVLVGFSYAFGQLCICYMSVAFGDRSYATVLVLRKLFSLLFSVFVFGNELVNMEWIGVAIVFVALFVDSFFGGLGFDTLHVDDIILVSE